MAEWISFTELARELGLSPHFLSQLKWQGRIALDETTKIAGRTLLKRTYVDSVLIPMLRRMGKRIPPKAVAS